MRDIILFTGGGTGGHVFPALAVLEELRRHWDGQVGWIGSRNGMERDIVERAGIPYYGIPTGKLRRYLSLQNVADVFRVLGGFVASLSLLARLEPRLVFSKGGYVSVPPVVAARALGIPTMTHESDVDPGLATRINARFSNHVLLSYEQTRRFFPAGAAATVSVTGNPVRVDLIAADAGTGRQTVGAAGDKPILLALGGSQGARELNELVQRNLPHLTRSFFVVHQMGSRNFRDAGGPDYRPVAFFRDEYPHVLAAADVVLCRAGAATLWELAAMEKPAVLLPLRHGGSRGDQIRNAQVFSEAGAAVVLEADVTDEAFVNTLVGLSMSPERRAVMAAGAASFAARDAAGNVAQLILQAVGASRGA